MSSSCPLRRSWLGGRSDPVIPKLWFANFLWVCEMFYGLHWRSRMVVYLYIIIRKQIHINSDMIATVFEAVLCQLPLLM
jgi:hypothetical protein